MKQQDTLPPVKVGDKLWYVPSRGQATALPEDCYVEVTEVHPDAGVLVLAAQPDGGPGAVVNTTTLRGFTTVHEEEDFGRVHVRPGVWEERKQRVARHIAVRCFRSKEHWQQHVETTRAWAKLLSRMQMHDQENMEPFTVDDIKAAELSLFGNIEE
jgi:hypothetical protein